MRIYRRKGSKIWYVQWRNRRTSLGTTDETAAQLKFRDLQRRDADPTYRVADPDATLGRELTEFIDRQRERGRAPDTIRMYELHQRSLCAVLGEHTPIAQVDAEAVERYVSVRTAAKASKSYRWKEICTLRGALKRARKQGRYPWALDQVMPDDLQPAYKPGTRHLLLPDLVLLMAELKPKRRAVVAFVVATGADKASIWRAKPGDFEATSIRVHGSKTSARARVVPRLAVFAALAEEAEAGAPYEPWASARRDLARACKRAGVDRVTLRDLRRSTGRILRAAGVDPSLIGPMLGHAPGSRVTAQTYAQIQPAELGALIDGAVRRNVDTSKKVKAKRNKRSRGRKRAA